MKKIMLICLLLSAQCAIAAEDCQPVSESNPISISVVAKKGNDNIESTSQIVSGDKLFPSQSAEKLQFTKGGINFSITPLAYCAAGLNIDTQGLNEDKERIIPWGKSTVIDGKDGTSHYIKITVIEVKP